MKMKGLGKGLEALLGETMPELSDELSSIDIDLIDPNPNQPRKTFDKQKLAELAESIAAVGVISPIIVYRDGQRYTIIAGERRFRAARMAKLAAIPAVVRDYDDVKRTEVALIENLQRDDLNPMEEAAGIQGLIEQCAYTQEQAAARLGRSRPAVANALRLLSLDEGTINDVRTGALSAGHARALLAINDLTQRRETAKRAISGAWSVRRLEQYIKELQSGRQPQKAAPAAELNQVGARFKRVFGTKITVSGTKKSGRITLHYSSYDELERIYDALGEGQDG